MFVVLLGVGLIGSAMGYERTANGSQFATGGRILSYGWLAFFLLYHPACWWAFGATLGQKATHLQVVRDSDGQRLTLGAVVIRYIVWFVLMLTVVLAVVAAAIGTGEPRKRTWPDEAAGSVVIKAG